MIAAGTEGAVCAPSVIGVPPRGFRRSRADPGRRSRDNASL